MNMHWPRECLGEAHCRVKGPRPCYDHPPGSVPHDVRNVVIVGLIVSLTIPATAASRTACSPSRTVAPPYILRNAHADDARFPKFESYPVEVYTGPLSPARRFGTRFKRQLRTKLTWSTAGHASTPNFAGEYRLDTLG